MITAEDKLAFWSLGIMIFFVLINGPVFEVDNIGSVITALILISALVYFWFIYPIIKLCEMWKEE